MNQTRSELRRELRQARTDFQQTKSEINRRLTANELGFDHRIRRNPLRSVALSGGLGFMIGGASRHTAVLLAFLTGVAVGYSLANRPPPGQTR